MKQLALSVTIIAAIGASLYFLLSFFGRWIGSLNPNVSAAIITASVGLIGLWYVQWKTRSREISENHRQSKIEVYNTFFDIVEKFSGEGEYANQDFRAQGNVPEQLRKDFQKLNRGLIIWGSPEVIKAWLNFREISSNGNSDILVAVDKMYQAIRKDLGNSNLGLRTGDLLKSMLSDPENWGK